MENIDKINKLLTNLTKILSKEATDLIYSSNNIKYDRVNLYNDFIQSLILIIFDTYMGDDFTTQENRIEHFKWCWKKNIENFKNEGISFNNTLDLYDYFMVFLFEVYYITPNKKNNKILTDNISKMWLNLFNMDILKSHSDMNSFLELYQIFEKSLVKR